HSSSVVSKGPALRGLCFLKRNFGAMMLPLLLSILLSPGILPVDTGSVAGTLRLPNGRPAAGIRVGLMAPPGPGRGVPRGAGTLEIQGQADAAGKYQLGDVPPGRYYVVAGRLEAPTYYPGVL